jgi:hypothetical protein
MSVVKLLGGLGNQLFQYAFGRQLMSEGVEVNFDLSWYTSDKMIDRPFVLDKLYTNVVRGPFKTGRLVKEGAFHSVVNKHRCNYFGYWQNPKYFKGVFPILQKEFCVKEEFHTQEFLDMKKEIIESNSVSVHVRRGDFADCNFYIMPLDYFEDAISFLKTIKKIDKVYVFSDDMQWCSDNFKDVTFVHLENILDFELMKVCKHNIIPNNSSISLWSTYLNTNLDKVVIVPKQERLLPRDWNLYSKRGTSANWIRI